MSCAKTQETCCFETQDMSFVDTHGIDISQNHSFGHELGPRGSPRAHIKSGRSHGLQEGF